MKILIPAYEPGEKMLNLIQQLQKIMRDEIVIVDDGSGDAFQNIFTSAGQMGCTVLHHSHNQGKGAALKTGLRHIAAQGEKEGVVCADCDGQHTPLDILKVAVVTKSKGNSIVLGSRQFVGKVPWRSRLGNTVTRALFSYATGCKIFDTQTGLRGYPASMFIWLLQVAGSRFEYELNILLDAQRAGYPVQEVPISTVYENGNRTSHFNPVTDSIRVYLPILKFSASSLLSAAVDFTLLLFIQAVTGNLLLSVAGARGFSSLLNFLCNKYFVFKRAENTTVLSLFRYYALAAAILGCNYLLMAAFVHGLGIGLVVSKLMTEAILFTCSYWIQRKYVFSHARVKPSL